MIHRNLFSLNVIIALLFFIIGCSNAEESALQINKITETERIFSLDDFTNSGFKKLKKYKIKDLKNSTGAFYGFYKFEDPIDYELRFYNSHPDAIEFGISLAEERAGAEGEDVILDKKLATFKEGLKDARGCLGAQTQKGAGGGYFSGGAGVGGHCIHPKYKNFVVYGNVIVLCQGKEPEDSMNNCSKLISLIE